MARCPSALALAIVLGACGGDPAPATGGPDAASSLCTTSADCAAGHWCNPKPVDANPADTICEPRATALLFDADIYPQLRDTCATCHVPGVLDPKDPKGMATLSVFAGGPDVAYASLVGGGTDCTSTAHKLCVNDPKSGTAVARLIAHMNGAALLLPAGYGDPWLQKLLHWTAGGAHRTDHDPDASVLDAPVLTADAPPSPFDAPAGTVDAPISTMPDAAGPPPDAAPPDAPVLADAPPDSTPPTGGNVTAAASDGCGHVTLTLQAAVDNQTPVASLQFQVCISSTSTGCMTNFTVDQTYTTSGKHVVDLSADEGATLFFAGRAVDRNGNASVPIESHSATIPRFLSWAAGGVALTKVAELGSYSVSWPTVSSSCASAPVNVQASCSGGSGCSCTVSGDHQSASCGANSCDAVTVTVTASAGVGSDSRAASYVVPFNEVSPVFDRGGCRGCHVDPSPPPNNSFGPTFTPADIGKTADPMIYCGPSYIYIVRNQPESSLIYGVASAHHFLCDPAGTNIHTFNTFIAADVSLLFCWINDGAN